MRRKASYPEQFAWLFSSFRYNFINVIMSHDCLFSKMMQCQLHAITSNQKTSCTWLCPMDTAGTSAPAARCCRTVSSAVAVCDGGPWRSKRRRSKGTVLEGQLEAARCCKLQWCQWSCTKRMSLETSNVGRVGFFQMWYSIMTKHWNERDAENNKAQLSND